MEETILTPEQVAQILQVHPFTVLKFIKQGKLKASRLGRVYRIRRIDVEKFLDEQTHPVDPKEVSVRSEVKTKKKIQEKMKKIVLDGAPAEKNVIPEKDGENKISDRNDTEKQLQLQKNGQNETRKSSQPDHYILQLKL